MAKPEQLEVLKQGSDSWNWWRLTHAEIITEISGPYRFVADLSGAELSSENLSRADLSGADLNNAVLINTDLSGANLSGANLSSANLTGANLYTANMSYASLINANLTGANLRSVNLHASDLRYAKILNSRLSAANLTDVILAGTIFAGIDLSSVNGLETVRHIGPSEISIKTLSLSTGLPDAFLRGFDIPEGFMKHLYSPEVQPDQFYSSFISYNHRDVDFVGYLYQRMRDLKLNVWCALEDMKGGETMDEQVFSAIQSHDKLLLVISQNSLESNWVKTEIFRARKAEKDEKRPKLFPIRIIDQEAIDKWIYFDNDTGEDLAKELRRYFIPDFSNWTDKRAFESAFERLLRDLKGKNSGQSR